MYRNEVSVNTVFEVKSIVQQHRDDHYGKILQDLLQKWDD